MKKALSIIFAVTLLIRAMSLNISAEGIDDLLYFKNEDGTITIYEYDGNMSTYTLEIPSTIDGYTVTAIDREAFCGWENLETIVVPDTVKSIGRYAFYLCRNLTNIIIPDSVEYIGDHILEGTWYYCNEANWENGDLYVGNQLIESKNSEVESYVIRDGTITVASGALPDCKNLKSITIPNSLVRVCENVFNGCTTLTDVYYLGTEEEWNKISIWSYNEPLTSATIHFTEPELDEDIVDDGLEDDVEDDDLNNNIENDNVVNDNILSDYIVSRDDIDINNTPSKDNVINNVEIPNTDFCFE